MYNFRYHLVTICSIFLALAIGLLLGAAISGSNLVRDTSQGMVDSLLEQFNEITKENKELSAQLDAEQPLTQQLLGHWQKDRLNGRTIVVLTGNSNTDADLTRRTTQLIASSGGVPVTVTVLVPEFGLTDEQTTQALQQLLPAIEGESYATTLAKALVNEWTYDGLPAVTETNDSAGTGTGSPATDNAATSADDASGNPDAAQTTESLPADADLAAHYPLTLKLVELGCISTTLNYDDFVNENAQSMSARLEQVWTQADVEGLPYAVNGLVDLLSTSNDENSASIADPVGLQAALHMDTLGMAGELPVYLWQVSTAAATSGTAGNGSAGTGDATGSDIDASIEGATGTEALAIKSEYVVLAQTSGKATGFVDAANQLGLSCVTTLDDTAGAYGLLALLTGAEKGVYGSDRAVDWRFPVLP